MKVYNQSDITPGDFKGTVCSIGNFDGVHRGHQKILQRLENAKRELGVPSLVYTFEPHPVRILNPKKNLKLIFDYEQRVRLLERYQPDGLVIAPFSADLAKTPAEEFVREVLFGKLAVKKVVVGYDFNFGRGGDGNADHLSMLGKDLGFSVEQVPAILYENRPISSSRIRRLVTAGEIAMVREMLGRPFFLAGKVAHGHSRGENLLGIPTANLTTQQEIIPARGVYAALVRVSQGIFSAAVNVGVNPTFDDETLSIEAHILDFSEQIYDQEMEIHFIRRLRGERRFQSLDRLKEQMFKDIEKTRELTKALAPEILNR